MSHHRYPPAPGLGPFARNASLIWCALNNWGGAVHLGGDLEYVLNETRDALATDAVVGVGLTPEGDGFEFLLDLACLPHVQQRLLNSSMVLTVFVLFVASSKLVNCWTQF